MDLGLDKRIWWNYADEGIKNLLTEAEYLMKEGKKSNRHFSDYAYIVFPAAKAYEGFLKKAFLDMGFITDDQYYGKRFRIGKALNPSLEKHLRNEEGVYDRIVLFCGGKELADSLWEAWKNCRNVLFHWFPNERNNIDYPEAVEKVNLIVDTMDLLFQECKIN